MIDELKTGHLYRIKARNAHVGIWMPNIRGFVIPREKLGYRYLFVELLSIQTAGTATPIDEIEKAPFDISIFEVRTNHIEDNQDLLQYLADHESMIMGRLYPEYFKK